MGEGHPLGFTNRKAENKEKDGGLSIPIRDILVEEPVESSKGYFNLGTYYYFVLAWPHERSR